MLKLAQALRISGHPRIAFTGAGGKSAALFHLASELAPAITSTTTHLGAWQASRADRHVVWHAEEDNPDIGFSAHDGVTLVTGGLDRAGERYAGLPRTQLRWLSELAHAQRMPLLIEADGSRQRPLKAPAAHEPAIPSWTDMVVVVAGLTGLGKPLDARHVHRPELFARLAGEEPGLPVRVEAVCDVLLHRLGGLKGIADSARRASLLNQADSDELREQADKIARVLLPGYHAVIVASLEPRKSSGGPSGRYRRKANVYASHERVAGIILAAGASRRFGSPKQLLPYKDKPFVRLIAETALASGLSPVRIVCGAHGDQVAAAIQGLPVDIVHNPSWDEGQSTSVRAGISGLPEETGAAVFLVADQPRVTSAVLRALVQEHTRELSPIVAPFVDGKRTNPVLFDRVTFRDLSMISGDVGGRALFAKFAVADLAWPDRALSEDIDTSDDYEKLTNGHRY